MNKRLRNLKNGKRNKPSYLPFPRFGDICHEEKARWIVFTRNCVFFKSFRIQVAFRRGDLVNGRQETHRLDGVPGALQEKQVGRAFIRFEARQPFPLLLQMHCSFYRQVSRMWGIQSNRELNAFWNLFPAFRWSFNNNLLKTPLYTANAIQCTFEFV